MNGNDVVYAAATYSTSINNPKPGQFFFLNASQDSGQDWNLAGAVQDVEVMRAIGADLANSRRWPEWQPGSEFKKVRDASAAARR